MNGWILALGGLFVVSVFLGLERHMRCAMEKRVDQLVDALELFLLEGEKNLEMSLKEGKMENLHNQLASLEDYILYMKRDSREREKDLNRFMENMAHQMKTSLTALQIRVDMAQIRAEGSTEGGNLAKEVEKDGNPARGERREGICAELAESQKCLLRLSREVERILECSRLADRKISMQLAPCSVESLLSRAVSALEPLRQKRGVTIGWTADPLPQVYLDSYWFSQALENVVKNALEHTRPGTAVQVALLDCTSSFRIQIRDQGPGIGDEELGHLFERFYRGSHTKVGYGIGLAMAKDIMEAHHGRISVRNQEGGGACFVLEVPLLEGARAYGSCCYLQAESRSQ